MTSRLLFMFLVSFVVKNLSQLQPLSSPGGGGLVWRGQSPQPVHRQVGGCPQVPSPRQTPQPASPQLDSVVSAVPRRIFRLPIHARIDREKKWSTRFGKGDSHTPCYSRARIGVCRGLLLGVCVGGTRIPPARHSSSARAMPKPGCPADRPVIPSHVVVRKAC